MSSCIRNYRTCSLIYGGVVVCECANAYMRRRGQSSSSHKRSEAKLYFMIGVLNAQARQQRKQRLERWETPPEYQHRNGYAFVSYHPYQDRHLLTKNKKIQLVLILAHHQTPSRHIQMSEASQACAVQFRLESQVIRKALFRLVWGIKKKTQLAIGNNCWCLTGVWTALFPFEIYVTLHHQFDSGESDPDSVIWLLR